MILGRVQIENESATLTLNVGAAILHGMHSIVSFTDPAEFPSKARQVCFLASRAPCTRSDTPRPRNRIHEDPSYQQQEPASGVDGEEPEQAHQLSLPERPEQFMWKGREYLAHSSERSGNHCGRVEPTLPNKELKSQSHAGRAAGLGICCKACFGFSG